VYIAGVTLNFDPVDNRPWGIFQCCQFSTG